MRNAGFHEFRADGQKTRLAIKPFRVCLRVQEDAFQADFDRVVDGGLEQLPADVASALFLDHRHATDLTGAGEQARGAKRQAHFVQRKEMGGFFIEPVPFDVLRNALLLDEYSLPNGAQLFHVRRPLTLTTCSAISRFASPTRQPGRCIDPA